MQLTNPNQISDHTTMKISKKFKVLCLGLLLATGSYGAELPYLTTRQLDIIPFMPAPVVNGSAEDKEQQTQVLAVQRAASAERIALANKDAEETVFAMFSSVMGSNFTAANLPQSTKIFERIGETEDAVVDPVKKYFGRIRPFVNNPEIKALVKPSTSGSYPSGHTSRSTMMAIILSKMIPEKRAEIFERANDYAQSRIIGGMHYPNDLEAGRRAGSAMAATLLASPTFMVDFEVSRAEIRHALGL
jgi:acid phosphatase (class A)